VEADLRALREPRDCDEEAAACQERSWLYSTGEFRDGEGPIGGVEEERPDQEQHRRDPSDEERHQRRSSRLLLVAVEAYEVVEGDGSEVPEDEEEDQVLRHREPHHPAHEEQHKEVEAHGIRPRPLLVLQVQRQVARGVDEDRGADPRCQQCV
jgi:hypothetical protein